MRKTVFWLRFLPFLLVSSCYTVNVKLTPNSPKELYFKKAQELATYKDYRSAIKIYELYLQQDPKDIVGLYTARYEIGYLRYKNGQYEEAQKTLLPLLEVPSSVPNWIPILSQEVLDKVNSKLKPKKPKKQKNLKA